MNITLFIGSVDGAAEYAGKKLEEALNEKKHTVTVNYKPTLKDLQNLQSDLLLIVTSTTGEGELPKNFCAFWRKLYTKKVSFEGISYAMAILGDSSYGDDYCLGGKQLGEILMQKGAKQVQQPLLVDSEKTSEPENFVVKWGLDILENSIG